jgi:hypothetical protein
MQKKLFAELGLAPEILKAIDPAAGAGETVDRFLFRHDPTAHPAIDSNLHAQPRERARRSECLRGTRLEPRARLGAARPRGAAAGRVPAQAVALRRLLERGDIIERDGRRFSGKNKLTHPAKIVFAVKQVLARKEKLIQ